LPSRKAARRRTADPLHSRLLLANGEALSLDTLLPLLKNTKLSGVILSACETAVVPSWRFADELLGFPAALLSHGAATVISS
jgi:CHAT domain-containing protein